MTAPEYDVRRGHAVVREESAVVAELIDLGGRAAIDCPNGALSPEAARALGHALISWAAWKRHLTFSVDHYQQTGGL